jgi:hypothetical protein
MNLDDTIITAWTEEGQDCTNTSLKVLIKSKDGQFRVECLQLGEQSNIIKTLADISAQTQKQMIEVARLALAKKAKTKTLTKNNYSGSGNITYLDPGKGLKTRVCYNCRGSGRVYEGGYGTRQCPLC